MYATMCDAHCRMLGVLQAELAKPSGSSVGATALFRRMEANAAPLSVLEAEFQQRWGSPDGAAALFRRIEAARGRLSRP